MASGFLVFRGSESHRRGFETFWSEVPSVRGGPTLKP